MGRLHVGDETLTVPRYGGVLVGPDQLRDVFNDTDAEVLWLIIGAPEELEFLPAQRPSPTSRSFTRLTRSSCPRNSPVWNGRRRLKLRLQQSREIGSMTPEQEQARAAMTDAGRSWRNYSFSRFTSTRSMRRSGTSHMRAMKMNTPSEIHELTNASGMAAISSTKP